MNTAQKKNCIDCWKRRNCSIVNCSFFATNRICQMQKVNLKWKRYSNSMALHKIITYKAQLRTLPKDYLKDWIGYRKRFKAKRRMAKNNKNRSDKFRFSNSF